MPYPCPFLLLSNCSLLCLEGDFLYFLLYLNLIHPLRPGSKLNSFLKPSLPSPVHTHHFLWVILMTLVLRWQTGAWGADQHLLAYLSMPSPDAWGKSWYLLHPPGWHNTVSEWFGVGQTGVQILICHFPTGCKALTSDITSPSLTLLIWKTGVMWAS